MKLIASIWLLSLLVGGNNHNRSSAFLFPRTTRRSLYYESVNHRQTTTTNTGISTYAPTQFQRIWSNGIDASSVSLQTSSSAAAAAATSTTTINSGEDSISDVNSTTTSTSNTTSGFTNTTIALSNTTDDDMITESDTIITDANTNTNANANTDKTLNTPKETNPEQPTLLIQGSKFARLKDLMWVRETMEDLTAAEFACSLDSATHQTSSTSKRAVDYDNLLSKLNKRLIEMGCSTDGQNCVLDDAGMGSMAMPMEQRTNLLNRIAETRQSLVQIMEEKDGQINDDTAGLSFSLQVPSIRIQKKRNNDTDSDAESGPRLYIRDDGTVDWEGALDDRDALRDFGISLWARINGQDPDSVSEESVEGGSEHAHGSNHNNNKAVTVKIEDTEEIRIQRNKLERVQKEYSVTEAEHLKLLNSAVPAGQAVANINLARINPELRSQIKQSTDKLEMKKEEVSFQNLIYELERIYTYFQREMESAGKGYIPLQDRLNVAEFGLLESQVKIFQTQLEAGEKVDEDVLKVVTDQVDNFKRRLAIDYYVTGFSFDKEAILEVTKDWAVQAKNGLLFYWKGTLLLFNDVVFASSLILRAVGGYTLKPREVRTLRRTFFDMLNFIPFVIILLIPLSPIGHVLVFQFIGKVYPDFFPSCFQESRQNLLQLYESTEYSEVTIQESLGDKLIRATQALFFFLTKPSRLLLGSSGDATTTTTTTTTPAPTTAQINGETSDKTEQ